LFYVLSD
jgi:septal ring factor EnvC (AmiA/AmiB activator)